VFIDLLHRTLAYLYTCIYDILTEHVLNALVVSSQLIAANRKFKLCQLIGWLIFLQLPSIVHSAFFCCLHIVCRPSSFSYCIFVAQMYDGWYTITQRQPVYVSIHFMRWPSLLICIVFFGSVRLFICFYSFKTSFVNILLCKLNSQFCNVSMNGILHGVVCQMSQQHTV